MLPKSDRLLVAGILGCLSLALPAGAETHLADWAAFDVAVETRYASVGGEAPLYPPSRLSFMLCEAPRPFDPDGFAGLTNNVPPTLLADGTPAWRLRVVETQLASRAWVVFAGHRAVRTNAVPATFDATQWVENAFGDHPAWLSGEALANWYAERERKRIVAQYTLISSDRYAEYQAALTAAYTNTSPSSAGPVPPADTYRVAFTRVATSPSGTFEFDLYTPGDLPVDVFSKTNLLAGPLWNYAGTVQAVAPFTPSAVAAPHATLFLHAARGDLDSDGDGIPDGMELLHFGTNPLLWDSSGDGLSDWIKLYRYGLEPLLRDSDGDDYGDDEELLAGTDPTQTSPGAASGAIRFYRDADDRVTAVYAGTDGGAAAATPTPVGNPASLQERITP